MHFDATPLWKIISILLCKYDAYPIARNRKPPKHIYSRICIFIWIFKLTYEKKKICVYSTRSFGLLFVEKIIIPSKTKYNQL